MIDLIFFPIIYFIGILSRNSFSLRQKRMLNYAILDTIDKICNLLDVNFKRYIAAIVLTESGGDVHASGSSGEAGLMQIMPSTFEKLNKKYGFNFNFDDLYAMTPNIYTGITLFKDNLKTLNYDFFDAIMAYNVGTDLKPKDKAIKYLNKVLENAK